MKLLLIALNFISLSAFAAQLGSVTEEKTDNPVYGQEYFNYHKGMKFYKLKKEMDPQERLFLSLPKSDGCGSGFWVFGADYQYNEKTNEIEFLKDEIASYTVGGGRAINCTIGNNTIIWVFYREQGDLENKRRLYGENVSVRTLDYLHSLSQDPDAEEFEFQCFLEKVKNRLAVELIQNGENTSTSYFYKDMDIEAIKQFICLNQVSKREIPKAVKRPFKKTRKSKRRKYQHWDEMEQLLDPESDFDIYRDSNYKIRVRPDQFRRR